MGSEGHQDIDLAILTALLKGNGFPAVVVSAMGTVYCIVSWTCVLHATVEVLSLMSFKLLHVGVRAFCPSYEKRTYEKKPMKSMKSAR